MSYFFEIYTYIEKKQTLGQHVYYNINNNGKNMNARDIKTIKKGIKTKSLLLCRNELVVTLK